MFEFTPIEPKVRISLYLTKGRNHVVVCWGNPVALLSVIDYLGTEQGCFSCALGSFPTESDFRLLAAKGRNQIIWATDEDALLPYYAKQGADLVLFGEKDGTITCHKDRSDQLVSMTRFRCTGSSSPTGRLPMPSSPAMHNMRPSDGRLIDASNDRIGPRVPRHFDVKDTSWRGYSMGASVKEPECPLCEAGLPAYKQGEKRPVVPGGANFQHPTDVKLRVEGKDFKGPSFEFKSYNDHAIMTHTSDGEMKLNDGKGREFIKVNAEGEAFVRGEKVAAGQQDIYEMFRAWMQKMAGGGVPLPKPGVIDAQGNVFTKECIDDLRKQVESHGLPVRMLNVGSYGGPVWDKNVGSKCNVCVDKKLPNGVDCPNCCASDLKPEPDLRIDGVGSRNIFSDPEQRNRGYEPGIIVTHADVLLLVEPTHDEDNCSDKHPVNQERCTRCALLHVKAHPGDVENFVHSLTVQPVWGCDNDDKRIITKTGHDITDAVRRQETASLINDVDSDPHITDSLRERIIAALKVR